MAKINHHNFVDTINDVLNEAKKRGVMRLEFNDDNWEGSKMKVQDRNLINFGTCGYMGLESHPKIVEKTIEFTQKYGTQFSVSRTYLTDSKSNYLEGLLSKVFNNHPVITFTSTTIAHTAVLPIVVRHNDAIILDQQAHISIQTAAQLMLPKGVKIEIIRHSNLEMLEHKIKQLRDKCDKIWYMIDGVYSMYGDIAPIDDINTLMDKYPQLHLYVDDAHGMSWYGLNGCGRIFKETSQNNRTIYVTTMAKGFGTMGGIVVFPNDTWYEQVISHGGPLSYSHPLAPPMLGAAIGSAEIHLTDEIYEIQNSLSEKLEYTTHLLNQTQMPVISNPGTPIFYIGTGQPNVGYNFNKRILDSGFYVTLGIFPGVPVKNTGLRFTITNHNTKDQIKSFIEALNYHYPLSLMEEGKSFNDVRKAFKLPLLEEHVEKKSNEDLILETYESIRQIDQKLWDSCYMDKGNFDWSALGYLEEAFSGNDLPEENWKFKYILVKDKSDNIVLATFLTMGIFKDDMLHKLEISKNVESMRKLEPYYLTSKTIVMGSMFSEGQHLFLNRSSPYWTDAIKMFTDKVFKIQDETNSNGLTLRDFEENDEELAKVFHELGFFKINMPESNIIDNLPDSIDILYSSLSGKKRKHIRDDVYQYVELFNIEFKSELKDAEIEEAYELYLNVANSNFALNLFKYPKKLFYQINGSPEWETICIYSNDRLVASGFCYKTNNAYFPVVLGLDYNENTKNKLYKQVLFQVVKRAIELNKHKIHLGVTANLEKRKLGANQIKKVAFTNIKDNFNFEILENMTTSI